MADRTLPPTSLSPWFWELVESAKQDRATLRTMLEKLSNEQILRFALEFREASDSIWGEPFTSHLQYTSDDDIEDMSYWVVSQGRTLWLDVWSHPELLTALEETTQFKGSLWTVAEAMLRDRLGDEYDDDPSWDVNEVLGEFSASGYVTIAEYVAAR